MTKPDTSAMIARGDRIDEGLLPCPFCGHKSARFALATYYFVKCDFCGNEGLKGESEEEAAEAWNRRAYHADAAEPVGWFNPWNDYHGYQQVAKEYEGAPGTIPLYAAPVTPPAAGSVTDEMVERALDAYFNDPDWRKGPHAEFINDGARAGMRAALSAAPVPPVVGEDAVERAMEVANLAYACGYTDRPGDRNWSDNVDNIAGRMRAALASSVPVGAALSQPVQVKVKALEWTKHPNARMWRATTIIGIYEIADIVSTVWQFKSFDPAVYEDARRAENEADAKAAAEADYERRILSSIEAAPGLREPDYFDSLVERAHTAAAKASAKFPQPNYVTLKIAEEAGEVVRGAIHYAENRMEWSEVEGEIVQLLAMLIRFVAEGDQVNGVVPPLALASSPDSSDEG